MLIVIFLPHVEAPSLENEFFREYRCGNVLDFVRYIADYAELSFIKDAFASAARLLLTVLFIEFISENKSLMYQKGSRFFSNVY